MALSQEQQLFFQNSQVRDENGNLLTAYHGTGTMIGAFDPSFTGQGKDQYGSGFYFTTDKGAAEGYATDQIRDQRTGKKIEKLGGEANPNVIAAYLNIENPIVLTGYDEADLSSIKPTTEQTLRLLQHLPSLYNEDGEENPLGDYFEEFWDRELFAKDYSHLIERLAYEHYADTDLAMLDRFFVEYPTEFRWAIREVMGYDGVIVNYEDSKHIVVWFPEQIKDVNNRNPLLSPYLVDGQEKERMKDLIVNEEKPQENHKKKKKARVR